MTDVLRGTRQDQSDVTLVIDGEETGTWEDKTGGNISSDSTLIYPGGRRAPVPLGGKPNPDPITLVRTVALNRDWPKIRKWQSLCGKQKPCTIKDQALDEDDMAFEEPHIRKGILTDCGEPERSSSSSDKATVTVVIQPTAIPG